MRSQTCNNHFRVDWGGTRDGFLDVSGLAIDLDVVQVREGASPDNAALLMPGQRHYSPVVLRRGVVQGDNEFFEWMGTAQFSQVERRDVTIALLDGSHNPTVVWRLIRAFPSKLEYGPLNALGSGVATESLTLVYEGLVVQHTT